jgi:hypothetical protein
MVNHTFHKGKMAQIIGRRYMYLLAPVCGVLQTRSSGQFHFMICRIAWTSLPHNQVTQITKKISSHCSSLAQQLSLQHLTIMDNNPQQTSLCNLLSKSTPTAHSLKQPETMVLSPAKQSCPNTSRLPFFKPHRVGTLRTLKWTSNQPANPQRLRWPESSGILKEE